MMIKSYKELFVWQKGVELVKEIYLLTDQFPKNEIFGLTSQMQRAVIAIPSNIAEGYMRGHKKEYIQFLSIALGSAAELETQLIICKSLEKFKEFNFTKASFLLEEIMKMLYSMIRKMKV